MKKWSVVIPTLWKSDYIHQQLKEYVQSDLISEIILIDNSNQYSDFYDKKLNKLKLIQPHKNLFVNPSWNLGVIESTSEYVIIANDDIVWDVSQLNNFDLQIFEKYNVLGQCPSNYRDQKNIDFVKKIDKQNFVYRKIDKIRPHGWGCLMLVRKKDWKPIPSQLKIWFGDDWLINKSGLSTGIIQNLFIGGEKNASEDNQNFSIRMGDSDMYRKLN